MGNAVVTDCRLNWKPLEQKGQSPGALEGHCMCCLENNAKLFLPSVGFSYDLDSGMWEKKVEMKDDEHRSGACCSVIAGREVFLFGGLNQEVGWMANLVKLDSQNMKYESWNEIANEPCARDKFSMVNVGGNLVVFGGFGPSLDDGFSSAGELMSQGEDEEPNSGDEMNVEEDIEEAEQRSMSSAKFRWFNDMHIFNLQKKQWRTVVTDAAPPPRAAHGMCVSGGFIYVFGGKSLDGRVNDLWRIPVVDILQEDKPELTPCWTMLTAGGILPSARSFHSFHSIPDSDRLIVFGGMDNNNTHLNDVHVVRFQSRFVAFR